MARYLTGVATAGVVKSIQQITTGTLSGTGATSNVTISAIDNTKAIIINNGVNNGYAGAQGNDVHYRSGGSNSPLRAEFTSSTNVLIEATNRDMFVANYRNWSGQFYGTVIEYA